MKKLRPGAKYIAKTVRRRSRQSLFFAQPMPRGPESVFTPDPMYCGGQVSRLIDQARPAFLPGLPVANRRALSNHGDEFVQESHLLPFSSDISRSGGRLTGPVRIAEVSDTFRILQLSLILPHSL